MQRTIRFDRRNETLIFGDTERRYRDAGFTLHASELVSIKSTDFKAAMASYLDDWDDGTTEVYVVEGDYDEFDDEYSTPGPVTFVQHQGSLLVRVALVTKAHEDDDEGSPEPLYRSSLAPYLARHRATLRNVEMVGNVAASPWIWDFDIECSLRLRTLEDLHEIGHGALALLDAVASGQLTRETTLDLLRAGHADVLIGQPEGPWLDVKSSHYDLDSTQGKISLAQSVSRFANAEHGGIVVVGMKGKKVPGGELIHSIHPVPVDGRTLRRYQSALEHHLYPPPDLLDIEFFETDGGGIVFLHVPPQPEELKPFLVHGAVVDGKAEGAFISIVRRRGEGSIPITAPAIHSTLAAGRALLRRGQMPD
ncbi:MULTISPECIES: ATP-binding protein [unclassified Streptomyces]|uniref:ATP-binding protein n=1 Tax=unclassified Streptomyces TaxID=2593676 RepID=UPI00109E8AA2|nr:MULTISPECIES: ATP-binding protein [unclassified Streptomyces]THC52353.1 ATP-binding protein [Streptomyces sp. A1499]